MRTHKNRDREVAIIWARTVLESRLLRVGTSLSEKGYRVKVFAWDREAERSDVERTGNFETHYLHLKAPYNSPLTFLMLPLWWFHVLRFLLGTRPMAVHACDFDCFLPSLIYSKLSGAPLVYDIFDIYGSMVENSVPGPAASLLKWLEAKGASMAQAVLMVNQFQFKELGEPKLSRVLYLVNSPSKPERKTLEKRMKEIKVTIPPQHRNKTLLFFAGSLQYARRFDDVLAAIKDNEDIFHVVAGQGADRKRLVPMFEKSKNTMYIGPISFDDVLAWSSLADILYVLFDSGIKKYMIGAQTRLFIGMMCGTPLIVTEGSNAARIIKEAGSGLAVRDGDIEGLRSTLERLSTSPELRHELGQNGKKTYQKKYSWKKLEISLLEIYRELLELQNN